VLQYACCDVNNRGVSFADGKILVGRLDGKLTALDAGSGKTRASASRRIMRSWRQLGAGCHPLSRDRRQKQSSWECYRQKGT